MTFWVVTVNFFKGGFRTFLVKTPSKTKKFFSEGGFWGQNTPEYVPVKGFYINFKGYHILFTGLISLPRA